MEASSRDSTAWSNLMVQSELLTTPLMTFMDSTPSSRSPPQLSTTPPQSSTTLPQLSTTLLPQLPSHTQPQLSTTALQLSMPQLTTLMLNQPMLLTLMPPQSSSRTLPTTSPHWPTTQPQLVSSASKTKKQLEINIFLPPASYAHHASPYSYAVEAPVYAKAYAPVVKSPVWH